MSFSLDTRHIRGVVLLDLSGRLTVGDSILLLHNTVRSLADKGSRKFVLNLASLSYIDSYGLGELIACFTSLRNQGGNMSLLNPTERTTKLLELTRLSTMVFDVFDDEEQAIEAQASIAATSS